MDCSKNYIVEKIDSWITYEDGMKSTDLSSTEYRKLNDLDCILTNGNLNADTIFSLWRPLRFSLVRINGYNKLNMIGDINDKVTFLRGLRKMNIDDYLPPNNRLVLRLKKLFYLGMTRANVMILPTNSHLKSLNVLRSKEPYHDYMPHFLYECLHDGAFVKYFSNVSLSSWIEEQKLEMFFDSNIGISREGIINLAKTNSVKNSIPGRTEESLKNMVDNYIEILEFRKCYFD